MTATQMRDKTMKALEDLIPLSTRLLFEYEVEKEANQGKLVCTIKNSDIIFRLERSKANQIIELFNYYTLLGFKVDLNHRDDFTLSWA